MKRCVVIYFLIISACNLPALDDVQTETETVAVTIPGGMVRATDSLLRLENGVWYYRSQPFSGTIVSFFESGQIKTTQSFYKGIEEGAYAGFYPDGSKEAWRWYHKGEKDSVHRGWWPNGNLRFEYHFDNGNYQGDYKEWYASGAALKHIVYANGKELSGRGWRANGRIYMSFEVRNGRMYGLINPNLCYSLKDEKGAFSASVPE